LELENGRLAEKNVRRMFKGRTPSCGSVPESGHGKTLQIAFGSV